MKMRRKALVHILPILIFVTFATAMYGQNAIFTGHVTDNTGAVIPKAGITVHNEGTGVDITAQTNGDGDYSVPYLNPGTYTVTATAPGFSQDIQTGIPLTTGKTATINFTLKIGAATEKVVVQSASILLDPGKADLAETIGTQEIEGLPLNGRDSRTLMLLAPAAQSGGGGVNAYSRPFDNPIYNIAVNGGQADFRTYGNNANYSYGDIEVTLDGNYNLAGQAGYPPSADSVAEVKVSTSQYDASFGQSGGAGLEQTLKTGTNQIHGTVYEYAERPWMNANTWNNDYYLATLPPSQASQFAKSGYTQDEYGAELDGPVIIPKLYNGRNKTFYLLQYEGWKDNNQQTQVSSVPDPTWYTGDFSNLTNLENGIPVHVTLFDPTTIHPNAAGVLVRAPYGCPPTSDITTCAGTNIIPTTDLNPVALKYLAFYAKPNVTTSNGVNFYTNNLAVRNANNPDIYRNWLVKVDHNLSDKDRVSAYWAYWERGQSGLQGGVDPNSPACCWSTLEKTQNFALDEVHTFSPNLIVNARAMVESYHFGFPGVGGGVQYTDLGWSSGVASQLQPHVSSLPRINLFQPGTQNTLFSTIAGGGAPGGNTVNFLGLTPSATWVKGAQTISVGMDARFNQSGNTYYNGVPTINTAGNWTQQNYSQSDPSSGNPVADLLLGDLGGGTINRQDLTFFSQHYWAFYVQDDWKVTPKLTLNVGLRWDISPGPTERHNRQNYAWDTTSVNPVSSSLPNGMVVLGGPTWAGINGNPRSPYAVPKNDIAPRIGFAYALDAKTVLRGGVGQFYKTSFASSVSEGYSIDTSQINTVNSGITPYNNLTNPFPTVLQPIGSSQGLETYLGNGASYTNPHYKLGNSWNYSFGIERLITSHDSVQIGYVANQQLNIDTIDNINRPSVAYYASCNLALGATSAALNACQNAAPVNPFYNNAAFAGTGLGSAPTLYGNAAQLTRPMPEWGDITETNLNEGHSWYNSLQISGEHRWNDSLTMHATYAWQKTMESGGWSDEIYRIPFRSIFSNNIPQRVTVSTIYQLPVGRGRTFLGDSNRVVDGVVGGWQLGGIYIYEAGTPWTIPGGMNQIGPATTYGSHNVSGTTLVQGVKGCVMQWQQNSQGNWSDNQLPLNYSSNCSQPSYQVIPPFGQTTNTVNTGVTIPASQQFDMNLLKNFTVYERMTLQLRFEAFNAFNHPVWRNYYSQSYGDPNFGTFNKVNGQSNVPRVGQLALKLTW